MKVALLSILMVPTCHLNLLYLMNFDIVTVLMTELLGGGQVHICYEYLSGFNASWLSPIKFFAGSWRLTHVILSVIRVFL